jgi:hypothetical protein
VDGLHDGTSLEQVCQYLACNPDQPARAADRLADASAAKSEETLRLGRLALANDPASPFRWCDLGDLYLALRPPNDSGRAADYLRQARVCFRRAEELDPANPHILQRIANFDYETGAPAEAVERSYGILEQVRDLDEIVFSGYVRFGVPQAEVLAHGVPPEPNPVRSYLRFLFSRNDVVAATAAWRWASAIPLKRPPVITGPLARSYVDFLWRQREFAPAADAWAGFLGSRAGDYPRRDRIYNGGFESDPDDENPLDWKREQVDGAEMQRDSQVQRQGEASMRITFLGKQNLDFHQLSQTQPVPPGAYKFHALVKSQDLTTDQGPRLRVVDPENPARLDVKTPALTGSSDWHAVDLRIQVYAPTRLVRVEVARQPSLKFDNKLAGTLWLDAVSLTPAN